MTHCRPDPRVTRAGLPDPSEAIRFTMRSDFRSTHLMRSRSDAVMSEPPIDRLRRSWRLKSAISRSSFGARSPGVISRPIESSSSATGSRSIGRQLECTLAITAITRRPGAWWRGPVLGSGAWSAPVASLATSAKGASTRRMTRLVLQGVHRWVGHVPTRCSCTVGPVAISCRRRIDDVAKYFCNGRLNTRKPTR